MPYASSDWVACVVDILFDLHFKARGIMPCGPLCLTCLGCLMHTSQHVFKL